MTISTRRRPAVRRFVLCGLAATASRPVTVIALLLALCAPAASALEPGDPAPKFSAASLSGKERISLSDYRGRVVYVDFWASWCGPCVVSLPAIDELRKEFPPQDFQILAINVDEDVDRARRFLARRPVGYPSASDPAGSLPKLFGLETMPTSYLIDRKGVVRYVHRGFKRGDEDKLREEIRQVLGPRR
jgi:peroxiredoxin